MGKADDLGPNLEELARRMEAYSGYSQVLIQRLVAGVREPAPRIFGRYGREGLGYRSNERPLGAAAFFRVAP